MRMQEEAGVKRNGNGNVNVNGNVNGKQANYFNSANQANLHSERHGPSGQLPSAISVSATVAIILPVPHMLCPSFKPHSVLLPHLSLSYDYRACE